MKKSLAIITLVAVLSATAHARVGETVKQVEARYGKPEQVLYERGSFRKLGYVHRGWHVIVGYVAGVSRSEFFDGNRRLSDAEVWQLLALNLAPGTTWN